MLCKPAAQCMNLSHGHTAASRTTNAALNLVSSRLFYTPKESGGPRTAVSLYCSQRVWEPQHPPHTQSAHHSQKHAASVLHRLARARALCFDGQALEQILPMVYPPVLPYTGWQGFRV